MNNSTRYRQELRERILKTAMSEFAQKGVKFVKMDDIANSLSISKRTIYEIYSNKEELLLEGLKNNDMKMESYMNTFANTDNHNVMDIILEFYRIQMQNFADKNPSFFIEMHKYNQVHEYFKIKHIEHQKKSFSFFQTGVKQGFFRSDVDYEIVSRLGDASMQYVMSNQLYKKYDISYIFRNIIILFIRGFCTPKGIKIIDSFMDNNKML